MKHKNQTGFVALFLAPALLFYSVFVIYPLFQTIWLSLFRYRGLSANKSFSGLANYDWLMKSSVFWQTLKNNGFLLVVGGLLILILSVAIAHAMQHKSRSTAILRSVFLFPQVISLVVVAVIWQFIYNPSHGLLNATLGGVGLEGLKSQWIAQKSTALPAVTLAFVWWALGFYVMLFTAGLQAIPEEVQEAAELDGAEGFKRFWRVTWPMLWSIKRIAAIYILTNVLNIFVLVLVMTQGGPDRATETLLTFLYQTGFEQSNYGRASAIAVSNMVVALGITGLLFLWFRKNPEEAR